MSTADLVVSFINLSMMDDAQTTEQEDGKRSTVTGSMDSNQLLSLCHRIRESMSSLEKSVRLVKLRLATLSYIHDDIEDWSLKCFDNLLELCNLSQLVVQLLEELHRKLCESSENSIDYQIVSQQLMFFTSEWYDSLAPKMHETFELASRQNIDLSTDADRVLLLNKRQTTGGQVKVETETEAEMRVRDALLRLKQSMGENERLLASLASNIEYTRTTIETIYDSLQSTKLNLDAGDENLLAAVGQVRKSNLRNITCFLVLLIMLVIVGLYAFRFLADLFKW